jgi:hypothetical protein
MGTITNTPIANYGMRGGVVLCYSSLVAPHDTSGAQPLTIGALMVGCICRRSSCQPIERARNAVQGACITKVVQGGATREQHEIGG